MQAEPFSAISAYALNTPPTPIRKYASKDALAFLSEVAAAADKEESSKIPARARGKKASRNKGASKLSAITKLELLAVSFKLCPNPSTHDLRSLATQVGMSAADLDEWFERRRRLESWAGQHPQLKASDIAAAFQRCQQQQQQQQQQREGHQLNHGASDRVACEQGVDMPEPPIAAAFVS